MVDLIAKHQSAPTHVIMAPAQHQINALAIVAGVVPLATRQRAHHLVHMEIAPVQILVHVLQVGLVRRVTLLCALVVAIMATVPPPTLACVTLDGVEQTVTPPCAQTAVFMVFATVPATANATQGGKATVVMLVSRTLGLTT